MKRKFLALVAGAVLSLTACQSVAPVKTRPSLQGDPPIAELIGNNTSTSNSFLGTSNGNPKPGNVSKVDIHSLLYAGNSTKVLVHYMPWFGNTNHINIGLNENVLSTVESQVNDMVSRGINGAVVDWYGPGNFNDRSTLNMKTAAEQHPNFELSICVDKGALKNSTNPTQTLINDFAYIESTYESSPNYMHLNGRPVVFFFGVESFTINWSQVRAAVKNNPLFIFEWSFSRSFGDGAFAWETRDATNPNNINTAKLDSFYSAGLATSKVIVGEGNKGFNDTIASWGTNRIQNQQCGQTWLQTTSEANKWFNSSKQLPYLQVVTWNDYEEGTEIETGIDNCVTVTGSMSSSIFNWSITGNPDTLDHYSLFVSTDGQNLTPLEDVPIGTNSLDLSGFILPAGTYKVYVQAVGKPSLMNHLSAPVSYTANGTPQPPVVNLTVTPTQGIAPLAVNANVVATDPKGTIVGVAIDFGDGTVVQGTSASHTYQKAGTYNVLGYAKDDSGLSTRVTKTVTVNAPVVYGVQVSSPVNGSTVTSPVQFTAAATTLTPVTGMKIYVDGITVFHSTQSSFSASIALLPGTHAVVVKAWDTLARIYRTNLTITVK